MSTPSANPTPTESRILTTFLLSRATLKDLIPSLSVFRRDYFSKPHQNNPNTRTLYNELVRARNKQLDRVRRNIEFECNLGKTQRREVLRRAQKEREGGMEGEVGVGVELFNAPPSEPRLPLKLLLKSMEDAAERLDKEYRRLDNECADMLGEIKTVVGDMSDLRYGKMSMPGMDEMVVAQLRGLCEVCEKGLEEEDEVGGDEESVAMEVDSE